MIKIKICGINRLEDALVALMAGADFMGFIFHPPSPRYVSPEEAGRMVDEIRRHPAAAGLFIRPTPPRFVGVFVNERPARIAEILDAYGLDLAQLSGDEEPSWVNDANSPLYGRAYKAIRPRTTGEALAMAKAYAGHGSGDERPRLLIDTPHPALYGGTGATGDWSMAAALSAACPGLMLAGGLNPANVAEAIRQVRPFSVDVAGGVESAPGRKDHALVRAFIANVQAVP
jgi:phosphoribosylanthranilate isomerase